MKTISRLEETCRMLKVKLGLPDSWTPREDILDDAIKTETQRLRESLAKAEKSSRDSVWAERKKIAALQRLLSQANDKVRRLKAVVSKNGEHQMLIMQKKIESQEAKIRSLVAAKARLDESNSSRGEQ